MGGRAEGPLAPGPAGFAGHLSQFSFLFHLGWWRIRGWEQPPASEKGVPSTPRLPNSWGGNERRAVGRGGEGVHTAFPAPSPGYASVSPARSTSHWAARGRTEAGRRPRGSRRGGRIPYLSPPPLPALLRRATDGSGLERREERGEQHLPQSPPRRTALQRLHRTGTARNGTALHGMAHLWYGMVRYRCVTAWPGTSLQGVVQFGVVWHRSPAQPSLVLAEAPALVPCSHRPSTRTTVPVLALAMHSRTVPGWCHHCPRIMPRLSQAVRR